MSNAKLPVSIFTGQRSQVRMVSRSYGAGEPALVQGVDFTPNISNAIVLAFGSLTPVINYTTFDDVTAKMTYDQNNQAIIEALIMDYDQTQDEVLVNPAGLVPFVLFANLKGLDGKIKGSYLLRGARATGNPFTSTVKEGAKRTLDIKALNAYYFHGLGISYARLRGTKTIQAPPPQPVVAQAATGGFLTADTYYTQITAVTAAGETTPSNEQMTQIVTGSVNKLTVTTPAIVAPVTAYNIYVSNRSNGEILAATVTSGISTDILSLPAATAARPPVQNTSGMPAVTGDVVMTLASSIWSGTLPLAAFKLPQTGLDYVVIMKNGSEIANIDNPASEDTFAFNTAGDVFSVFDVNGDNDWWDVFTLYKP